MRMCFLIAAILLPMTPAWAEYRAPNGLRVQNTSQTDFHIPYQGLSGAPEFWCAAGYYVVRELGQSPQTRIYRVSPPPRRSGEGVSFSLRAERATKPGVMVLFSPDAGLSAAAAQQFCELRD